MKQFTLELSESETRPIVLLREGIILDAMLDTGALFPVWVGTEELLKKLGGKFVRSNMPFGGFGGMTQGNLYIMPNFCVGELVYPDLPVVVSPRHLPCKLILSATMFTNLIYEIDDKNHRLNIAIPDTETTVRPLKVREENGRAHIFCT